MFAADKPANVHFTGSAAGSPTKAIPDMLEFAAKHNIKPWIKKWPMAELNKVMPDFVKNGARYRHVLVNDHQGGKL